MSEPALKKLINLPIWVQNELLIAHLIEVSQRNHFMLFGLLDPKFNKREFKPV